jgi:hypothetical protein
MAILRIWRVEHKNKGKEIKEGKKKRQLTPN